MTGLAECHVGIASGQADEDILNKYDEVRRSIFHTVIDPISTANFLRVTTLDTNEAIEKDPFLAICVAARDDPAVKEKMRKVHIRPYCANLCLIMLNLRRASMLLVMTLRGITIARLESKCFHFDMY